MRYKLTATLAAGTAISMANVASYLGYSGSQLARLIPLRCPVRMLSGLSCPTCGLGRSLIAASTGRWAEAWSYHPLGLPLAGGVVVATAVSWLWPAHSARMTRKLSTALHGERGISMGLFTVLLVTFLTRWATGALAVLN